MVPESAIAAPSLEPPKLRLGDAVAPSRYSVELTLVSGNDSFEGVVDIQIDVRASSRIIWLNTTQQEISRASFQPETGAPENAGVAPGGNDYAGFVFDRAITGKGVLRIAYKGRLSRNSSAGIWL
jgi:hypothetical protein